MDGKKKAHFFESHMAKLKTLCGMAMPSVHASCMVEKWKHLGQPATENDKYCSFILLSFLFFVSFISRIQVQAYHVCM